MSNVFFWKCAIWQNRHAGCKSKTDHSSIFTFFLNVLGVGAKNLIVRHLDEKQLIILRYHYLLSL